MWVLNDAPDLPTHLIPLMIGYANHADAEGRGAYPSQARLARYCRCSDRTVRRWTAEAVDLGLLVPGDQRFVFHLPADRRPTVYDLPLQWIRADGVPPPGRRGRPRKVAPVDDGVEGAAAAAATGPVDDSEEKRADTDVPPFSDGEDVPVSPVKNGRTHVSGRTPSEKRVDTVVLQTALEPSPNTSSLGSTYVADARVREATQEEDSKDSPKPKDRPAESPLERAVAEIHGIAPTYAREAIRDALGAAVAAGRDPSATWTAALSLARGEHGPTKFSFRARLCSDGPWWETAGAAQARDDSVRLAHADRCPTHQGQLAHHCSGCLANEKVPVEDREQADPDPMETATARTKIAEAIEAAKAKRKGQGGGDVPVLPQPDPDPAVPRRALTLVRGGAA